MLDIASWSRNGATAIVTFANPPVNAISQAVRVALVAAVRRANAEAEVSALVIICDGRTFFAGADLREFGKPSTQPFLTEVVDAIEASDKPVIAAIHGNALGGGLEIAMACHYRVAVADARLGLPEVKLGLMPGARGTQHLPRLVGVERALQIIALGEPVRAAEAQAIGLVDLVADQNLLEAATTFAEQVAGLPVRRTRDQPLAPVDETVYAAFAKENAKRFRGLDAPPAIIASIRAATELPFEEGARREREIFLELREGPQNEALRYVFFAEREAGKVPGLEGATPRPLASVGVIGSGTMGSGIALALLGAGFPVHLFEREPAALERGLASIRKVLARNVAAGRMSQGAVEAALASLTSGCDMEALAEVDLVIEAAYETMAVKQAIFTDLDRIAKPGAILASNTSYLDLDEIAAVTSRGGDVLGLHFFSPANVMKLLEIVQGAQTSPEVIATAFALAKRLGKVGVLARNSWGFIGNRMLAVRRRHAEAMVVEGAPPGQVDGVMERFGMAMGPLRVGDLAGLDLGWSTETSTGATIRERLCEAGRRGQKSGAGFYDYGEDCQPVPSPEAQRIIADFARDTGVSQRSFTDEEVLDRLLWPMVDEGAQLLAEDVAVRESDIDVVWLNGYGWPRWTGGPMFHARQTGLAEVERRLESLRLPPSGALRRMASDRITVDRVQLEVRRWGEGTGLPILLLHEGLGSIRLWKDFPAKLAQACGREVIAWSRRGHGWSDPREAPREPDYMHREADLLPQVMDALGLERAHWFGHSDGGSIALIAAAQHPARVSTLILEAPHVLVEDLTHTSIADVADQFPHTDMGERMSRYHADAVALFNDWAAIWLDPRFRGWNIEPVLEQITIPALLIQGRQDQYGTLDQLDRIAAALGETTRLELDECQHSPHFDQPEDVLAAVRNFLESRD